MNSLLKNGKNYEILEHKADLKIRVFGKTKEELFSNALLAEADYAKPDVACDKKMTRQIKISSPDLPSLLVDFLSEVLYLSETNKETYNAVKFIKFTDTELEAEIFGQEVERFGEDIKAVTYHQLEVHEREDGFWEAIILFDI